MSVTYSSEKVSAFSVQTPIGLFCLVTRDLRLHCFKNKFLVIWDGEVLHHNYMQTQMFISLYLFS